MSTLLSGCYISGAEVGQYIQNFGRCIVQKTPPHRVAPLNQITSKGPLDLVCIDFLSLEPDSQGYGNVLVVTDHYTRYAQAFPAKDQKASTVAKILSERYFVQYGLSARIHSDQGRDFEGKFIHDLLKMLGIQKSRTTPYHPQGDPQPERFNRNLLSMLGMLDTNRKQKRSQNIVNWYMPIIAPEMTQQGTPLSVDVWKRSLTVVLNSRV